jgi:serine phosphatase RsbU (regulator of sigma subunit)
MARDTSALRLSPPPLRAAIALLMVWAVLAPSAAPASASKRDGPRGTQSPVASKGSSPGPGTDRGNGSSEGCCAPAAGHAPAAGNGKHRERLATGDESPSGPRAPVAEGGGNRGEPAGGGAHSPGPPASARRRERQAASKGDSPKGAQEHTEEQAQAAGEEEATLGAAPSVRRHERPKGKHGKGKEEHGKGKEGKHGGRPPEPVPVAPPPVLNPAPAVVASASFVSPAVASAPVAPAPTTSPAVLGHRQPTSPGLRQGAGRQREGHARGATVRRVSPSSRPGSASPLPRSPAVAVKGPRSAPRTSRRPPSRGQSPLVTTVTKIINVIPTSIRIVIGALIALALVLGASSQLAALRARRLVRQRRELLDDVGLLQAALLPPTPARLGPVGTSSAYRPASGPGAGGDFYDLFALADGQLAVIVGDVSGHGREALPQTTLVRFTLRAYLEAGLSPRSAMQMAAPVLERQLGESLATVVLATYHPRDRKLVYACAGHPPPLVIGSESLTGSEPLTPITACSSPPIGAGLPTGMRQTVVSLPGESQVCFYTDGLIEARVGGELFGAERLERTLTELPSPVTASALLEQVAEDSDKQPDDMAACLLLLAGDRRAPAVEVEELELDRREAEGARARRFLLAGGLQEAEIDDVMRSVRRAAAREGGVVLELRITDGSPEVTLRPRNVTMLQQPPAQSASAVG